MMHTTLVQVDNSRSAFHGGWRFALCLDGRILWASNPGNRGWAERNARKLWPTLELI